MDYSGSSRCGLLLCLASITRFYCVHCPYFSLPGIKYPPPSPAQHGPSHMAWIPVPETTSQRLPSALNSFDWWVCSSYMAVEQLIPKSGTTKQAELNNSHGFGGLTRLGSAMRALLAQGLLLFLIRMFDETAAGRWELLSCGLLQ